MPIQFNSREEILAHWGVLRGGSGSSIELDLVLELHPMHRYIVSLATLADCNALCELGDEFVHTHTALFDEYCDVDQGSWCRYLGLTADVQARHQSVEQTVRENLQQVSLFSSPTLCHGGCILKCEYDGPLRTVLRESATPLRGSNSRAHTSPERGKSKLVGYVQFSLEEGAPSDAPRFSKRLKRKRGECTGEYTKISHLVVTHAHQKRGLGALLLAGVLQRVQRLDPGYARELFLTVVGRNAAAVGLYQRLGFSVIGRNVTHLLRNGECGRQRPIEWYQMGIERSEPDAEAAASTPPVRRASARGTSAAKDATGVGRRRLSGSRGANGNAAAPVVPVLLS